MFVFRTRRVGVSTRATSPALLAVAAATLCAGAAEAQPGFGGRPGRGGPGGGPGGRGGFDPAQMFDRFDTDGDGTLSIVEIRSSPLARMGERMGLDTSKPLTRDAFSSAMQRGREERGDRGERVDRGERGDRGGDRGDRGDDRGGRGGDRGDRGSRGGSDDGEEVSRERRIFDYVWQKVDKNGDGKLSRDETSNNRVKRFMQDRGLDPNREYSREDWNRGAAEYEDKKMTEEENEAEEDRRNRRGAGGGGEDRSDRNDRRSGPGYVRGGAVDGRGRPVRVTRSLPESFGAFDADGDGQVGLYEWRQWNRALVAEFLTLDTDGDGFLTPRELGEADAKQYQRGEGTPVAVASSGPADSLAADASPSREEDAEPAELNPRDRAAAERYFKLLDRDRSGRISLAEWERSSKLKPQFEAVGADLASELDLEAFVGAYAKTLD